MGSRHESDRFDAAIADGPVIVRMLATLAAEWSETDRVGVDGNVPLGDGTTMRLLIEKDFACLTEQRPEDRDAYPHPDETC